MNKPLEMDKSNRKSCVCCATDPHRGVTQWSYRHGQWHWVWI